jgi:hypothetical protein
MIRSGARIALAARADDKAGAVLISRVRCLRGTGAQGGAGRFTPLSLLRQRID